MSDVKEGVYWKMNGWFVWVAKEEYSQIYDWNFPIFNEC